MGSQFREDWVAEAVVRSGEMVGRGLCGAQLLGEGQY